MVGLAQWLPHLPLVLKVPGSIPVENFGVQTRFAGMTLDKYIFGRIGTITRCRRKGDPDAG